MRAEEKSIIKSFIPGIVITVILWLVKAAELKLGTDFHNWGIYPRSLEALKGIITMPFIHDDLKHLFSNSIPLIILMAALVYFYRSISFKVFTLVWILSGAWLWLGGRPAWHIGASGVVYGIASFLFFSGVFRKHINLMALSLLIVFLYGGLIWGIFPLIRGMSWEAHLYGGIAGFMLAFVYRSEGPQRKVYDWELEEENENNDQAMNQEEQNMEFPATQINYEYRPSDANNEIQKDSETDFDTDKSKTE